MRYTALAVDFDGTIAHDGVVPPHVADALARLRATGRKLLLVTGRELEELLSIFPRVTLFDRVVAENGALLYRPQSGEREGLGEAPPAALVERLRARGVPLSVGHSIVATVVPHEGEVLEAIRELGLERQVIFNKGAVMILPAGVNKASGLAVALRELALSPRNLVAAGDGENDHALLAAAEYSVATANAIPTLREKADRVTRETHGDGVLEVIADLIESDLAKSPPRSERRRLLLGRDSRGAEVTLPAWGAPLVVAGGKRAERTAIASGIIERVTAAGYQACVIDTRGEYTGVAAAVVAGSASSAPDATEVITALEKPDLPVVANLSALAAEARAAFSVGLLRRLAALRTTTGRPHWIVIDDAAEVLCGEGEQFLPDPPANVVAVTAEPGRLPARIAAAAEAFVAGGADAGAAIESAARSLGVVPPPEALREPGPLEALLWRRRSGTAPERIELARTDAARDRERAQVGRLVRRA